MARTILFEAHNLTLAAGTGIATYARHLSQAARTLGYSTQALVGINANVDRLDPVLGEIQLYDAPPDKNLRWLTWPRIAKDFVIGAPFGITPFRLPSQGLVIQPSPGQFAAFDDTFAAPFLFDRGRMHFRRWKRFADVKPPSTPDLFHATHPTPLKIEGCPNIVTIHDIVPLRLPYATLDDKKYTLNLLRALCRKADHIVTVSEFSKHDIMSFFGLPEDRITNTYQSVSIPEKIAKRGETEIAADLHYGFELEPGGYFLFFGAIEPKKNVQRLIHAYSASGVKAPLLIVGALGWQYERDVELIDDERFTHFVIDGQRIIRRKRVHRLPYTPFPQLVSLIRGARGVIFPSLYEGFGLPVLEAMSLGAPVITSNVSSLPEISGDAALLVDPTDTDALSDAIRTLDADADLRAELSRRGRERAEFFSPEKYAQRLDALYRRILK
jgi:glycosyltransferase involved in cell wall biosynthesis